MFVKVISSTLITVSVITLASPVAHACWICDPWGETVKSIKNPKKGLKNLETGITDALKKTRDGIGRGSARVFQAAGEKFREGDGMISSPEVWDRQEQDFSDQVLPAQTSGSF